MTYPSYTEWSKENYSQQITLKLTPTMLKDIEKLSDSIQKPLSEAIRYLVYLGICSLNDY